ncbi:MAG: protein-methionine-sulfoxide reductase catalytic subunit MsrP [Pseudomonadota bacterium]|jgi:sulfoxide reductase catalytic subunit YedY
MGYRRDTEPKACEITPEAIWQERRQVLSALLLGGASAIISPTAHADAAPSGRLLPAPRNPAFVAQEPPNSWVDATTYNNFYEFGTDKSDPARNAGTLRPAPWSVTIGGEAQLRGTFALDDLLKPHPLEERIYRLRCVEAWSMVIPWIGFPLAALIQRFKPTSKAKYVAFTTLQDPVQMPGQRSGVLDWPYVEGLRIDEATHPLAFLAVGLYGRVLPNQSGAPLRLVVPWKYGFKSAKSIVRIDFLEHAPKTTWAVSNPREYGFYANVNPAVDHPRWSQKTERAIGAGLFAPRRATRPFNGYSEVASLYTGMDLAQWF